MVGMTSETLERMRNLADDAGMTVQRYLVSCADRDQESGWSVRDRRWWVERLDRVERRLIRNGTNLNQIAAAANSGRETDAPLLAAVVRYHAATLDEIREMVVAGAPERRT